MQEKCESEISKEMTATRKSIALVCPGGPITRDLAESVSAIANEEFADCIELHFHEQCFLEAGHFAGTDDERSSAFLETANDPSYDAIWFARGGYGACRLDEGIWQKLNGNARAKTYLGYSDTGVILGRLYKEKIGRPVHGPMATDFSSPGGGDAIARALGFLVTGDMAHVEPAVSTRKPVAAFNITVLTHMVSTPAMPDLTGHIVMLEDVGEYLYRTDRALCAITSHSSIKKSAGLMLGRISNVPENDRPFGLTAEEVIKYWCARENIPYLGRADIGHDSANKIVPFGLQALS